MGRYNLSPSLVQRTATHLLNSPASGKSVPPPWYTPTTTTPPPTILTRPPLRRPNKPGSKPSKTFSPIPITYEEDALRWEYFNDHPWELARPRVVLEDDGKDGEKWDWSLELDFGLNRPRKSSAGGRRGVRNVEEWDHIWITRSQCSRPINGESIILRQRHLLTHTSLSPAQAYDKSRKEFYRHAHAREIERRVGREEAESTGAFFGLGPLEVGMQLENKAYADWKLWAIKETEALRQAADGAGGRATGITGVDSPENDGGGQAEGLLNDTSGEEIEGRRAPDRKEGVLEELNVSEVAQAVPRSRRGQTAMGGAGVHP